MYTMEPLVIKNKFIFGTIIIQNQYYIQNLFLFVLINLIRPANTNYFKTWLYYFLSKCYVAIIYGFG